MPYERLEKNIISVIKEAQLKLGYESIGIGVNYVMSSLCHLFGECREDEVAEKLRGFAQAKQDIFGPIEIVKNEKGYRLNVPPKGADYVHSLTQEGEFLVRFIDKIRQHGCTVEAIKDLFLQYSDAVHFEKTDNGEFDYLVYFENGEPDEFWYCIHEDELMLEYHRFIKEDYLDFGF